MQKQSNIFHYALIVVLLCMHVNLFTQELQNPSFEGATGVAKQPFGWKAYGQASSPDTQPGAWRVNTEASHGDSYVSMVCRGFSIFDSYLWESCIQELNNSLTIGETYHYSIDLAHSNTFLADTISFNQPAQLRIWGMSANTEKELLWESGAVANTSWEPYYFEVTPSIAVDYFILEAYYVELPKYCGNILLDNIKYYPNGNPNINNDPVLIEKKDTIFAEVDTIPSTISERPINQEAEFTFRGDQLTITVWDHRTNDGDIVSLFLNNKNILDEFTISKKRLAIEVPVEEGKEYFLTLYAHNLGRIPPNTVALYISDGLRKKFITLTSDLKACGAVKIKVEPELAQNID